LVNALPDIRPAKIKESCLPNLKKGEVDTDQKLSYLGDFVEADEKEDGEDDSTMEIEPKLYEYIFLIDRSGSMSGSPITLAKEALILFLHSLPMGAKFNVVSFGSDFEKVFEQSVSYDE
jgi:Mg-chelatase subunit ChlD